jgi:hypothetical protein
VRGAKAILAPDFIQQAVAGKHFTCMPTKELQELHFPGGQFGNHLPAF